VISLVRAGSGPPLLLPHGYPQTLAVWHRIAPDLARYFTVISTCRGQHRRDRPGRLAVIHDQHPRLRCGDRSRIGACPVMAALSPSLSGSSRLRFSMTVLEWSSVTLGN